jgi:hypothetical protein
VLPRLRFGFVFGKKWRCPIKPTLFGTDTVAPRTQKQYLRPFDIYSPLLAELTPKARMLLFKGNYERIFDQARKQVRAWEKVHVLKSANAPRPSPAVIAK